MRLQFNNYDECTIWQVSEVRLRFPAETGAAEARNIANSVGRQMSRSEIPVN
jgi:hypothetical protein